MAMAAEAQRYEPDVQEEQQSPPDLLKLSIEELEDLWGYLLGFPSGYCLSTIYCAAIPDRRSILMRDINWRLHMIP